MQKYKQFSYYGDSPAVAKIVEMGREIITLCEKNELYPKDDELWNAAVTAGNKMVTTGTPWSRFKDTNSLTELEKKALIGYLEQKG